MHSDVMPIGCSVLRPTEKAIQIGAFSRWMSNISVLKSQFEIQLPCKVIKEKNIASPFIIQHEITMTRAFMYEKSILLNSLSIIGRHICVKHLNITASATQQMQNLKMYSICEWNDAARRVLQEIIWVHVQWSAIIFLVCICAQNVEDLAIISWICTGKKVTMGRLITVVHGAINLTDVHLL